MKVEFEEKDGRLHIMNVANLVVTLSNGESVQIIDDSSKRPADVPEGIVLIGGKQLPEGSPMEEVRAATRSLGIHPLAGNMIRVFPLKR